MSEILNYETEKEKEQKDINLKELWEQAHHPNHYQQSSLECIEVMKLIFGKKAVACFCICNAFKYLWRYKFKNGKVDLEKAKVYLDYYAEIKLPKPYKQSVYNQLLSLLRECKTKLEEV